MIDAKPFEQTEIETNLQELPDWRFEDDRLKAEYTLADFDQAMAVVEKVAAAAREMDHHPLWTNVYNRLTFSLCTHRAGDKVTELDTRLAQKISDIISKV